MTTKIKPLGNRIVVKREEAQVTKGGIILPDSAQKKPRQGKVVAVGKGKMDEKGRFVPMNVKAGDEILFSSYGGTEYKVDDQEYLILTEDDILAVFN